MKQRFFQNSMLGYYAYHQYDATPLMCSSVQHYYTIVLLGFLEVSYNLNPLINP